MTRAWSLAIAIATAACANTPLEGEGEIPETDTARFATDVYPLLLANCGFVACHGGGTRPFSVYGPGRTRLDPELDVYAPVTAAELAISYGRARSMLVAPEGPRRAPLLRKPLAVEAGGAEHGGDDPWGGPIFASKRDPRYVTLFYWAIDADQEAQAP
jgi:hypothetical protein